MKKIHMLNNTFPPTQSSKQRGFTLVEIMVAIVIMSTISLALIKMNEMMNKTSKNMSQQLDVTQLMAQLDYVLRDSTGCFRTFGASTMTNGEAATTMIRDPNDNPLFAVPGGTFGDLTFVSATFRNVGDPTGPVITMTDPAAPPATMTVQERGAQVRLVLRKGRSANEAADHQQTVGTQNITRDLTFRFYSRTTSPDIVAACSGDDTEYLELACDLFNGTLVGSDCRDITVFSVTGAADTRAANFVGRVGVNTVTPLTAFHLSGAHETTQARLTLPDPENGGGTGEVNMQLWLSEPDVSWEGGGIGTNVTNNATFGRLNEALGQSYIRFITNGGAMAFNTTSNAGAVHQTMYMVDGNVGINTTGPTERLHVSGNGIVTGNFNVGGNLAVTGESTLTGDVNRNTQLRIGASMAGVTQGLCYKNDCITSWRVGGHRTLACTNVEAGPNASAQCPSGYFVSGVNVWDDVGVSNVGAFVNVTCCPLEVR
ncbi:MAG: type II secretion system protein [Bacteriovoracia bacterium]